MRKNTGSNSDEIIVFDTVSKAYDGKDIALADASFSISRSAFACIIGPSGGGKSTIVKMIAGIEEPSSGHVMKPQAVSMVFQSGALLPWLTAQGNVSLVLEAQGADTQKAASQAKKYLRLLGLRGLEGKMPRELSGGERQRVGIARALAVNPSVLLLDDPFSALDPKTTDGLHRDIVRIWSETGKTVVMVSHSIEEAVALGTQVILVKDHTAKKIFEIGLPYPRIHHAAGFARDVAHIRREFFR